MTHAIRVHAYGGPDVLKWEEIEAGEPGPGEVKICQTAIGLNYIDVYSRTGFYPQASLPFIPGMEAAGVVTAVGEGVKELKVGRRVAYAGQIGAYAEERLIPADRVVRLPEGLSDELAASIMLKGMTAQYLLRRTYTVGPHTTLLFHAAAGGVGLIACQWAASLGATVIGTVGSAGKALIARAHGCAHVINYREEDFVTMVKAYTNGKGVDVVYELGRQGHLPGLARLPEAARAVGELRPGFGPGAGLQDHASVAKGLALRHAAVAWKLHGDAKGSRRYRQRSVRGGADRQGQGVGQPDLSSGRGGARPPRSRGTSYHRLYRAVAGDDA